MEMTEASPQKKRQWGLLGALGAAIAASICCLGPLVLVALGASGAWIGGLSALEPYRPIFVVITAGFLGLAFYRVYRKPRAEEACDPGSVCARPGAKRFNKIGLWIVTLVAVVLLAAPSVIGAFATADLEATRAPKSSLVAAGVATANVDRVMLAIDKMTCAACTVTLAKTLKRVAGVRSARVTLDPPRAVITFDPSKVSVDKLVRATASVGYPSRALSRKGS